MPQESCIYLREQNTIAKWGVYFLLQFGQWFLDLF